MGFPRPKNRAAIGAPEAEGQHFQLEPLPGRTGCTSRRLHVAFRELQAVGRPVIGSGTCPSARGSGTILHGRLLRPRGVEKPLTTFAIECWRALVAAQWYGHTSDGKARPVRIDELMGSQIDALSSSHACLFRTWRKRWFAVDPQRVCRPAEHAETILAAAAADGYGRCTYTEEHLRRLST